MVTSASKNIKKLLDYKEMTNLIEDISHDIFLYVIERQPNNFKLAKHYVRYAIKSLSQKPLWYSKYLDMPVRRKEAIESLSKELEEIVENNVNYSTLL